MASIEGFLQIPTIDNGVILKVMGFVGPIWVAFIIGVLIGWSLKPYSRCSPSGFFYSVMNSLNFKSGSCSDMKVEPLSSDSSSLQPMGGQSCIMTQDDLECLCKLVEMKDGGPTWKQLSDHSTSTMRYQLWQRDPETGPPQYRTRTVFENVTPELVRDFFWDDEFRSKWNDMLLYSAIVEECPTTGIMIVHWIRKFPLFIGDKEYTIGRRIWVSGRSYYCVTKSVPCTSVPRRSKPKRIDLYYSSWCIRPVEPRSGNGDLTACEVLLFHHEDTGIPSEVAKLGVRLGMRRVVSKIDPALRAYQRLRSSSTTLSRCALMAQINTQIDPDFAKSFGTRDNSSEPDTSLVVDKPSGNDLPKFLVFGGVIVLALSLNRGLLTKAIVSGVVGRFAKVGKRL